MIKRKNKTLLDDLHTIQSGQFLIKEKLATKREVNQAYEKVKAFIINHTEHVKPIQHGKFVFCKCGKRLMKRTQYLYCQHCGRPIDWSEFEEVKGG